MNRLDDYVYITIKTRANIRIGNGMTIKRPWYKTKNRNVKVGSKVLVPVGLERALGKVVHVQTTPPAWVTVRAIISLIKK